MGRDQERLRVSEFVAGDSLARPPSSAATRRLLRRGEGSTHDPLPPGECGRRPGEGPDAANGNRSIRGLTIATKPGSRKRPVKINFSAPQSNAPPAVSKGAGRRGRAYARGGMTSGPLAAARRPPWGTPGPSTASAVRPDRCARTSNPVSGYAKPLSLSNPGFLGPAARNSAATRAPPQTPPPTNPRRRRSEAGARSISSPASSKAGAPSSVLANPSLNELSRPPSTVRHPWNQTMTAIAPKAAKPRKNGRLTVPRHNLNTPPSRLT